LTSWELEKATLEALRGVTSSNLVEMMVDIGFARLVKDARININADEYVELREHVHRSDVYTCYLAMKDFEPDLKPEDLENGGLETRDLAAFIRRISAAPQESVYEFVKTPDGRSLATIHYELHVPLVSDAWKATRLQLQFLDIARDLDVIDEVDNMAHKSKDLNVADTLKEITSVRPSGKAHVERGDQR